MRQPPGMARLTRRDHCGRRAASALRIGAFRVEPEPEGHSDRLRPGLEQRHGAVDAAAHRDRHPVRIARGADCRAEGVRERIDRQLLTADRRGLEQRQAAQILRDAGRVRIDDPGAVDPQAHSRPVGAACRIAVELDHRARLLGAEKREGSRSSPHRAPMTPISLRPCEPGQARWVPCRTRAKRPEPRHGLPFTWCWFYMDAQHTNVVEHSCGWYSRRPRASARTTIRSSAHRAGRAGARVRRSGRTAVRFRTVPGRRPE